MTTLTRNSANKDQIKIDGVVSLQAANGEGEAILEEMIKYSKGNKYTIPTQLNYQPQSKCWTNHKGKIVLFNIAEQPQPVVIFVKEYLSGKQAIKAKTDADTLTTGVVATDNGTPVSLDTDVEGETKAIKLDPRK